MFISERTLRAIINSKDETIVQLQAEVRWLRNMVQPSNTTGRGNSIEADLVLSGHQDQLNAGPKQLIPEPKRAALDDEAAKILSGSY